MSTRATRTSPERHTDRSGIITCLIFLVVRDDTEWSSAAVSHEEDEHLMHK